MSRQTASGIVIVVAAIAALAWANSPWDQYYFDFWHAHLVFDFSFVEIDASLGHLVNDGLMVIFFFVVGLEIKRELVHGELASARRAALPVMAATGGMLVPATLYIAFNGLGGDPGRGWGVPVATDIAFAVGILALVGRRAPFGLRVFLLACAIADDLGGILIIAVFYTDSINFGALAWAGVVIVAILAVRSYDLRTYNIYLALGLLLWLATYQSGIHATLAGVVLALLTPAEPQYEHNEFNRYGTELALRYRRAESRGNRYESEQLLRQIENLARESESPLDRLTHMLHPWVSYAIVPIFALANAGVVISSSSVEAAATSAVTYGVIVGLVVGKPLGIFVFTLIAVRSGIATLPAGVRWGHIVGVGMLGGVGFTVALFITELAFTDPTYVSEAKMGILAASVIAGALGFLFLYFTGTSRDEAHHGASSHGSHDRDEPSERAAVPLPAPAERQPVHHSRGTDPRAGASAP